VVRVAHNNVYMPHECPQKEKDVSYVAHVNPILAHGVRLRCAKYDSIELY
jgi:hypothetical protein